MINRQTSKIATTSKTPAASKQQIKKLVVTKQSSLKVIKKKGVCINDKLNKNVLSCVFQFFSCQDLLMIRLACKMWNQGVISHIKLQTKFNPFMKKKNDLEDLFDKKAIEDEIKQIPEELIEIYKNFDSITPDNIYECCQSDVYPTINLLFKLTIQFQLLKAPRYLSLTESQDWRLGYIQVYLDKVILPLRITKQYTIRKFLRLFNLVDIDYFKKELQQIRFDFINKIQYIPLVVKKMELFLIQGIQFYEQYKKQNPRIVEYMEAISALENNRKEIIIAKNINKKYS